MPPFPHPLPAAAGGAEQGSGALRAGFSAPRPTLRSLGQRRCFGEKEVVPGYEVSRPILLHRTLQELSQ